MKLWEFSHNVLGTHVFYLFAIIVVLIMAVSFIIQRRNQKKRDGELKKFSAGADKSDVQEKETKEVESK